MRDTRQMALALLGVERAVAQLDEDVARRHHLELDAHPLLEAHEGLVERLAHLAQREEVVEELGALHLHVDHAPLLLVGFIVLAAIIRRFCCSVPPRPVPVVGTVQIANRVPSATAAAPAMALVGGFRQVQRPIRSLAVALLRAGTRVGISSRRWRSGALTVLIGEEWNAARVAQRPLVVETRPAALAMRAPPRHVDDLERRRQLFLQQMQRQQGLSMGYKSSLAAA